MSPPPASWDELLAAARAGSGAACGQLLEAHRPYLFTVATAELDRDLRAKADAADLIQETLFEAVIGFSRFDGCRPAQLRAWLREILLHNIANFRRYFKDTVMRDITREVPLPGRPGGQPGEGLANDDSTPSRKVLRREEHERLQQALARIPGHYRDVIVWHLQEERGFADIGQRLGRSADAAKQLWRRALQYLTNELGTNRGAGDFDAR
jgi:RNA polymerase sigma-70 factor (ECF subfamily)